MKLPFPRTISDLNLLYKRETYVSRKNVTHYLKKQKTNHLSPVTGVLHVCAGAPLVLIHDLTVATHAESHDVAHLYLHSPKLQMLWRGL